MIMQSKGISSVIVLRPKEEFTDNFEFLFEINEMATMTEKISTGKSSRSGILRFSSELSENRPYRS